MTEPFGVPAAMATVVVLMGAGGYTVALGDRWAAAAVAARPIRLRQILAAPFADAALLLVTARTTTERPDGPGWALAPALLMALAALALVMLPLGPEDNEISFTMDGEESSLKKSADGWTVDFLVDGKRLQKAVTLKPVNDPKSQNAEQYEITLRYGDPLWKAMGAREPGHAMMMIGTGGTPVELPGGDTFNAFLKSCGISPGK